jgi:hypothetical protein
MRPASSTAGSGSNFKAPGGGSINPDMLAQERDARFRQWLQEKELRDKAVSVLISWCLFHC